MSALMGARLPAFAAILSLLSLPVGAVAVEREAPPHYVHDGRTWFFCTTTCRDEFAADPERFAAGTQVA